MGKIILCVAFIATILLEVQTTTNTSTDTLTNNFVTVGNRAEAQGATVPGWDAIKTAESNLLKETLHSVKDQKKVNENQIDKLYSSTCFEIL